MTAEEYKTTMTNLFKANQINRSSWAYAMAWAADIVAQGPAWVQQSIEDAKAARAKHKEPSCGAVAGDPAGAAVSEISLSPLPSLPSISDIVSPLLEPGEEVITPTEKPVTIAEKVKAYLPIAALGFGVVFLGMRAVKAIRK